TRTLAASVLTVVVLLLLPIYPLLKFKPEERELSIDPMGIHSTIGSQSVDLPWSEIAVVVPTSDQIYLVRRNFNAFVIPRRAFSTSDDRQNFLDVAIRWFEQRHGEPVV